jgi:hypothetical protein
MKNYLVFVRNNRAIGFSRADRGPLEFLLLFALVAERLTVIEPTNEWSEPRRFSIRKFSNFPYFPR